jgi:hypothetical protein
VTLPLTYRPAPTNSLTNLYVTVDGWSATAVDAQGTEWWLSTVDGWNGSPDVRLTGVDRPQDHGGFDGPTWFGSRIITLAGTAIALDQATAMLARDIVASLCWDPSQLFVMQVTEPGRPVRRCSVRLNAPTKVSPVNDASFDWQVQLKSPDPRRYDDTLTTVTLTPPTGLEAGVTFPVTAPFTVPTVGTGPSQQTLTNAGTIATRPVVTFAGPLVDPQIANLSQGKTLSFTITLASGDLLAVDFDRRSVTLNGTASRSNTLNSTAAWWDLDPGGNDIKFTAGGGSGSATITYRSSWL